MTQCQFGSRFNRVCGGELAEPGKVIPRRKCRRHHETFAETKQWEPNPFLHIPEDQTDQIHDQFIFVRERKRLGADCSRAAAVIRNLVGS
jgi:hypothetical protein